jgi:Family of unknown function (DUF6682)
MQLLDIKRRVKRQFGDEGGVQLKDTDIVDWVNDAQREIYTKNNLGQKVGTLPTIVGTREYAFPADLMRLLNVKYNGITLKELAQQEVDEFLPNDDGASTTNGTPSHYWTYADKMVLFPTPDAVKNLTIRYNRFPTDVAIDANLTDLDQKYDNRILDYCHAMGRQLDGDLQGYVMFMQRFEGKVQNTLDDEFEMQQSSHYPYISVSARDADEFGVI